MTSDINMADSLCCDSKRIWKRERVVNAHRASDLYMEFQSLKRTLDVGKVDIDLDFVPDTPKASSYTNKRDWERAMFTWKNAMRLVVRCATQIGIQSQPGQEQQPDRSVNSSEPVHSFDDTTKCVMRRDEMPSS